jgi:hypothetical protein
MGETLSLVSLPVLVLDDDADAYRAIVIGGVARPRRLNYRLLVSVCAHNPPALL